MLSIRTVRGAVAPARLLIGVATAVRACRIAKESRCLT
jgi:hypothetical protein